MPSLPAVFVELKASTESFRASFAEAQKTVKNFSDQSTSGLQKLESVGKVAFAAVTASAVAFGTIAVKAALDGQQAHAQLAQAVQNSGTAFASVSGQVDDMSGRFAKLGYENDQVEAALTRLVQATGSTSAAMQNMSLVADIARARHMDLTEAAGDLGKVLAGNMRGMTGFGLSTKDAAGNTLTASAAVAELNQRFGGAAQANAGTYMGKLQAVNAEWHNMVEAIGNELLPTLASLAGDMAGVIGWFNQHRTVALGLAAVIGGPLTIAMSAYVAKQTIAFGTGVINSVKGIAAAIGGLLVPATEAEEAAMTGAAVAESILTAGITLAAGAAAAYVIHQASSKSATDDTAASVGNLTGGLGDMGGAETDVGVATDATNSSLQTQSTLLKQLSGDTDAQQSELLKLIGDQNSVDTATQKLKDSTGANSEVTKQAAQHAKDLTQANKDLKDATRAVSDALDKQSAAKKKLDDLMKPQTERNITDAADAHSAANDRLTRANIAVTDKTKDLNAAIAQYGQGSEQATLAQLDLNDALREVDDAQNAVSDTSQTLADNYRQTTGTTDEITQATKDLNDATQAVTDAQNKQKDAQTNLNTVLADKGAIDAAKTDAQNLAQNTLAWQQATAQLNTDWGTLNGLLATHPELRDQLVGQITALKDNLPKGADIQPLNDLLSKITAVAPTMSAVLAPGTIGSALVNNPLLMAAGGPAPASGQPTDAQLASWFLMANPGAAMSGGAPSSAELRSDWNNPTLRKVIFPGRQFGGPVYSGRAYTVGENGPEPFIPSTNGTILPNSSLGGVSIGAVTIVVQGSPDIDATARAVRDKLLLVGRNLAGVGLG